MAIRIAFIGMGEAGSAFVTGWGVARAGQIVAYDIKTDNPAEAPAMWARYDTLGIRGCDSARQAVADADLVLSTVTADQAVVVARSVAPHLVAGVFYCDLNSCAPSSKKIAAGVIEGAGGRYVDVAVMSPVHPKLNMVPLLVSGPHAKAVTPILAELPMATRVVPGDVGQASSIKIIRSVMVKGLEAVAAECLVAAAAAGVHDEVIIFLQESTPNIDWARQSGYQLERMISHGKRRAAEMEEAAKALAHLGLPSEMSRATATWEARVAGTGVKPPATLDELAAKSLAAEILHALRAEAGIGRTGHVCRARGLSGAGRQTTWGGSDSFDRTEPVDPDKPLRLVKARR